MRLLTSSLLLPLPFLLVASAHKHPHRDHLRRQGPQAAAGAPGAPGAPGAAGPGAASSSPAAPPVVSSTPAHVTTTSAQPPTQPGATSAASTPASSAAGASSVASVTSATTTALPFTLAGTNPTAVPLSAINSNQTNDPTINYSVTPTGGTKPTFITNAPPLPSVTALNAADYPLEDHIPPTDSPQVQQWIQEVINTGIVIPNIPPTDPTAGCSATGANAAAAADKSRCWWSCGGCTVPGIDISDCPTKFDWGLTYDDGPAPYTPNLVEYLDEQKLKATFFVIGSRVREHPVLLQAQYLGQHQIAVHTWSHAAPLTSLTNEQIVAELGWSKKIIKDTLGVTPNMMRPPFGDIDNRVRAISLAMGLTPVMWSRVSPLATFDTEDFYIHGGTVSVQQVLQNWENIIGNASTRANGFIVLEHDLWQQTVEVATGYILPDALAHKPAFGIKPVISCLQKTMGDAYIETNDNSTNTPPLQAAIAAGLATTTSVVAGSTPTAFSGSGVSAGNSDSGKKSSGESLQARGFLAMAGLALGSLLAL